MNTILIFNIEEIQKWRNNIHLDVSLETVNFSWLPLRSQETINMASFIAVIDQEIGKFVILKSRYTSMNENKPLDMIWFQWFLEPYLNFGDKFEKSLDDLVNKMRHSCERIG